MARRRRLTPFARFILVMVIAAPLAYLGASYYNGEDGIQNLKELIGIAEPQESTEVAAEPAIDTETPPATADESEPVSSEPITDKMNYEDLQNQYNEVKQENADLKQTLREKELEIQELKRKLRLQETTTE